MISVDDVTKGRLLGEGMGGSVWSAVGPKKEKYALKIEKTIYKKASPEVKFSLEFANAYPEQFQFLYGYDVIKCDIPINNKQKRNFKSLPPHVKKRIEKKLKSNYCERKLYTRVNGDAFTIIKRIRSKKTLAYSYALQVLNIIYILKINGYSHNDLHLHNIGYIRTTKTHITSHTVPAYEIPTFGYHFIALDFGNVSKLDPNSTKCRINNDLRRSITRLVYYEDGTKLYHTVGSSMVKNFTFIKNLYQIKTEYNKGDSQRNDDYGYLYQLLFTKQYCEINGFPYQKLKTPIDVVDIVYMLQYKDDLKSLIQFFFHRLNELL